MTTAENDQLRSDSFVEPRTRVPGQPRSEGIVHGPPGLMHLSFRSDTDFVDYSLLSVWRALRFSGLCPARRCGRDNLSSMNSAVRGRRLASPVRLTLAIELGTELDGAWWPRTASVARELPELIGALSTRLGQIIDISVNWSSLEGSPDLDSLNRTRTVDPARVVSHQRLMMITGSRASANLLVVPCRTSSALAVMVLRQAAAFQIKHAERDTQAFRTADDIVRAARAESARCARRLQGAGLAHVVTADSAESV